MAAIVNLIVQLVKEGSFRTVQGIRILAEGYFIVFYEDAPVERKDNGKIVPD